MIPIVDFGGVDEVLETPEYLDGCVGQLDDVLDLHVGAGGGKFGTVVGGLCAEEVFLDAEGDFVGGDEDDYEYRMGFAGEVSWLRIRDVGDDKTYCHDTVFDVSPGSATRSTP